jgi:phosphomannomutase
MGYIFDVDGTLTPSLTKIDKKFHNWFLKWMDGKTVFLVTGSDREKTLNQLGERIVFNANMAFHCSGNVLYAGDTILRKKRWSPTPEQVDWLNNELDSSKYPERTGKHFEHRDGAINFSIVGRNAVGDERTRYHEWDLKTNERVSMAERFKEKFPEIDAVIGGLTGLDIYPVGQDKGQVAGLLGTHHTFIGDRCQPGGNDYALAAKMDEVIEVRNWEHTWEILRAL